MDGKNIPILFSVTWWRLNRYCMEAKTRCEMADDLRNGRLDCIILYLRLRRGEWKFKTGPLSMSNYIQKKEDCLLIILMVECSP